MSTGATSVRSFFRTQMDALQYKEWKGGFNFDNIPSTLLDGSYHLETIESSRNGTWNQQTQYIDFPINIRLFLKGYRNPADAIDNAVSAYDSIMSRVLEPSRRLGTSIKNIFFDAMKITELAQTNDNAAILEITFNCLIIFS